MYNKKIELYDQHLRKNNMELGILQGNLLKIFNKYVLRASEQTGIAEKTKRKVTFVSQIDLKRLSRNYDGRGRTVQNDM
jgi:hypothetical protein